MQSERSKYELNKIADEMLANAGYDIFGRKDSDFCQRQFEYGMQTGAYSSNQSRNKRRYK